MGAASHKQIAAVKRTFNQLQEDATHASHEAVEAMNTALAPHIEVIAKVINDQEVTSGEVHPVIGALFDIAKVVGASAAASRTPGIKGATRIIKNRFAKVCVVCGERVEGDAGFAAQVNGAWLTYCQADAANPDAQVGSTPAAPKAKRLAIESDGIYQDPEGIVYKVQESQESGNLYAKVWDGSKFVYTRGAVQKIQPEWKMTLEQAKKFGKLYGTCCKCARTLTDEASIEAGIGPVCATRF